MSSEEIIALALVFIFGSSVILTRRLVIAPRVHDHTDAEIRELEAQLPAAAEVEPDAARAAEHARRMLREARAKIVTKRDRTLWEWVKDAFMWSGSADLVAFEMIHEAKLVAIATWSPAEIRARLRAAACHLDELPAGQRRHWKVELPRLVASPDSRTQRAGLAAFSRDLYAARDTRFAELNGIQNKTTWLIGISTLIVAALAVDGFDELLMAGAVGGIISRAHRVLGRSRAPTEYGLSWTRVFIAPIVGALAAWAGALILIALRDLSLVSLDPLFTAADPMRDPSNGLLGLAVVLGFSERFLNRMATMAQGGIREPQHGGGAGA